MMDFNDFEFSKDRTPRQYTPQHKLFFEELKNKFYLEIKNSDKCSEYFKTYDKDSVEAFMLEYAQRKAYLAESYEYINSVGEKPKEIKYRDKTEALLSLIRQKKLFNLQLLWRAEKIEIKEINMCYDFEFWEKYVDSCPFIPPISEQEISVMKQYLKSNNYRPNFWYGQMQDYDFLIEKNENGDFENMLEWYEFYDGMMGTGSLLLLPDIRGGKEELYTHPGRKELNRLQEEERKKNPPPPYNPPPPTIYAFLDEQLKFSEYYETDKHFIELFRQWKIQCTHVPSKTSSYINDEEVEEAISLLEEAEYTVIMPGGYEWREAIVLCARQYLNNILADELDTVFEEYLVLADLGISKGPSLQEIQDEYDHDEIVGMYRENILKGREICGEPRDFNF